MKKTTMDKLLQTTILTGMVFTGASFSAYAQTETDATTPVVETITQSDDEDDADDAKGDVIVVTGSRLRRSEFTSASPLQVIDGEFARDLGLVDAADLLGQTTVVQGQQITTGFSTSGGNLTDSGPGSSTASLRGLSPGRTLVLVNGRRLAPAGVRGAPSAPDLNLIPGTLIERVDVLLDGASSVYGSDAVAGVVNYNLRKDFEGIQLDAYATVPEFKNNEGHQEVFSATAGVSNDKGFIGFALEHSRSDGVKEFSIGEFYEPYANGCVSRVTIGASGTIYEPDLCSGSFGAASAISPLGFVGFDLGANLPGFPANFVPISITAGLIQPDNVDGQRLLLFPEELQAAFTPDFQRTSIFTFGEYDTGLYGDMQAYFEASHASRETNTNTRGQGAIELPGSYPLNQFGGATTLFFGSTFINDTRVAQSRFVGGIRGKLPFLEKSGLDNWEYDAYWSYSESSGQDKVKGVPYFPRLEQTISNTTVDPITGVASCATRNIPAEGQGANCRPLDFFEPGFLQTGRFADQADNDYLFPSRLTSTIVKQSIFSAYVSGDLFDIPTGGTVVAGFGGELREDIISTDTSLAGEFLNFFDDPGSNGRRTLKEYFGEIELPLLQEQPLAHELTLNLAGRVTDESNFGSEATYSIKGQYRPVEWLTLRGTYGTSFRAPNLGEQFGGAVVGFANPVDPCRVPGLTIPFTDFDNDPTTPDTRNYDASLEIRDANVLANCTNGGGPFGLEPTDPFATGVRGLNGPSPVFLSVPTQVASGSNPNLTAETSNAITFGAVVDQPFTDLFDLKLSVSYFKITVDDEVQSLTARTIVNRCYNSVGLTDPTCAFITRDPRTAAPESGEISFVSALNQNLGTQIVEGIDYNAEFGFDFKPSFLSEPVDYALIVRATQSLTQTVEEFTVTGITIDDDLGEFGNPKWRLSLTNSLRYKDFGFLFQTRYIGSQIEDNADLQDPVTTFFSNCRQAGDFTATTPCLQYDGLEDYWLHSASVNWTRDTLILRAGVNNVFDNSPPLTDNNSLSNLAGIGYDLGGRTFFMNVTKKF